uniref:enkurin isoform X1 n=2 Tax=Myxine glutinosa TaxID=7769 RepID=UPI00358E6CAE
MLSEESIYNLVPQNIEKHHKPPRYISQFKNKLWLDQQPRKIKMKTMGPVKVVIPSPKTYLRKHSQEPQLPEKKSFQYPDSHRLPPIPQRKDCPALLKHDTKNFIKQNVMRAISAKTTQLPPIAADTVHGNLQLLEHSGLLPKFLKKKEYGKVPSYIVQKKAQISREKEAHLLMAKDRSQKHPEQLSSEDRDHMLKGLKQNRDKLYQQFILLPLVIDTVSQRNHKTRLEQELSRLERDIMLIERNPVIYIKRD